jgi:rubrerythrin
MEDFSRAPFLAARPDPAGLDRAGALAAAREIEAKAADFYAQAAVKLAAMPEVNRALKMLAKKRGKHREELAGL